MASFWNRATVGYRDVPTIHNGTILVVKELAWVNHQPPCFDLNRIAINNASYEQRCNKMLKDGILHVLPKKLAAPDSASTIGAQEESWSKHDEEAFLSSLDDSNISSIRSVWRAGSVVVADAQKTVDTRLVDPDQRLREGNWRKCIETEAAFGLDDKEAIREMCAAFADMFGARS